MRAMFAGLSGVLLLSCGSAAADDTTEYELRAEAVTVVTLAERSDEGVDPEDLLYELSLTGKAERVLDNGVRILARGAVRLQKDHPLRPGFTGGFSEQPLARIGAYSGLSSQAPEPNDQVRGRFETAYFQIDGGYGEARIGKDLGVAARFHEGAPSVLTHARLDSPLLDPSGVNGLRSRHDLTGPSAKLSYATPRLLGVRAGLSYTPEANADGLDRRPAAGIGPAAPKTTNAVEVAVNTSHRLNVIDTRLEATAAYSTADVEDQGGLFTYERLDTSSFGARVERGDWSVGGSWLASNNGNENADYTGWSAGIGHNRFGLDWSLNYGSAEDEGANLDTTGWRFGAAKEMFDFAKLAVVYTDDQLDSDATERQNRGIVVEITLSAGILNSLR